jgi:hypothetical protein
MGVPENLVNLATVILVVSLPVVLVSPLVWLAIALLAVWLILLGLLAFWHGY